MKLYFTIGLIYGTMNLVGFIVAILFGVYDWNLEEDKKMTIMGIIGGYIIWPWAFVELGKLAYTQYKLKYPRCH